MLNGAAPHCARGWLRPGSSGKAFELQLGCNEIEQVQLDRIGIDHNDRLTAAASSIVHSLSETMFESSGARLMARWGCLPPEGTIDPAALEPVAEPSWILDLDMFSTAAVPFAIDPVVEEARRYAERIYTVFRWAVTDEFLQRFGVQP